MNLSVIVCLYDYKRSIKCINFFNHFKNIFSFFNYNIDIYFVNNNINFNYKFCNIYKGSNNYNEFSAYIEGYNYSITNKKYDGFLFVNDTVVKNHRLSFFFIFIIITMINFYKTKIFAILNYKNINILNYSSRFYFRSSFFYVPNNYVKIIMNNINESIKIYNSSHFNIIQSVKELYLLKYYTDITTFNSLYNYLLVNYHDKHIHTNSIRFKEKLRNIFFEYYLTNGININSIFNYRYIYIITNPLFTMYKKYLLLRYNKLV